MYGCPEAVSFTEQPIDLQWKSPLNRSRGGVQQLNSDNLPWKLDHLIFSPSMTCHWHSRPDWSSIEIYNYSWMPGTLLQDHWSLYSNMDISPHAWQSEARQALVDVRSSGQRHQTGRRVLPTENKMLNRASGGLSGIIKWWQSIIKPRCNCGRSTLKS